MSQPENTAPPVSVDEIQNSWRDLTLRVQQLESGNVALEGENKALRQLLERAIDHRKKSHGELVNMLTTLVSKLPINDIGVVVARLVEHNAHVGDVSAALINGKNEDNFLQPAILKALDKTKRDLKSAVKPLVEELIKLDAPLDAAMLESLIEKPDVFFSPQVVRASRGYVKGQIPRERIVKEFGEEALFFFKDLTTDAKFNPRPKPEEIMLALLPDFESLLKQNPNAAAAKRNELVALHQKILQSRAPGENARAQKMAFLKLSFIIELLHYYENQSTESPDVIFAQRLPPLIGQLVVTNETDPPDENLIKQAEALLALILSPDYRQSVVNNFGKSGGAAKTMRLILTFRGTTFTEHDPSTADFMKHLVSLEKTPRPETFIVVLKLLNRDSQKAIIRCLLNASKLRREEVEPLAKAIAKELGLSEQEIAPKNEHAVPENNAWDNVRHLIADRATPNEITVAIRNRLKAKYDDTEVKQSWLVLAESEPMTLVRVFCLLPYLPDGQTDPIARAILEAYASRLTHEKYAAIYAKVIGALKNLFKVKADSPALLNFIALVKWVDPAAADKISKDIGLNG